MLIRKLRLENGWSQEQLAQMAGISTRTLQRAERGRPSSPETLKCLAAVLDVDHAVLTQESPMSTDLVSYEERQAMKYVDDLRGVYSHLMVYVIVIALLTIVNLVVSPREIWVIWPAFGWGIGLTIHAVGVFQLLPFFGPDWEKHQIEKRLKKMRR